MSEGEVLLAIGNIQFLGAEQFTIEPLVGRFDLVTRFDKRLLESLIQKFDCGPVGLNSLAVSIGEEPGTLEEVHEPYLIMEGFLKRTPQGRVASKRAYDKLGLKPTGAQQDLF